MRIAALFAVACIGCEPPAGAAAAKPGSIAGVVKLVGHIEKRPPRPPATAPDGNLIPASKLENLLLGPDNALANVYVAVESGLSGSFPTPSAAVPLRQAGFLYEPRVVGLMKDQVLIVRNDDNAMHNVHFRSIKNPPFNKGQSRKGDKFTFKFYVAERGIRVNCDVHPWEVAWLHVSDHPFFAVTGADGRFSIGSVPPGEYELLAWHERFKDAPLVAKVKVESGKTATLDFTFESPRK